MRIDLRFDSAVLVLRLRNGQRRLAYAVVNAINNTAKRIQETERRRIEEEFTIRKKDLILREAATIKPFANVRQARAYAEIAVRQKPRLLLSAFERGAERTPFTPNAKRVAEPVIGGPAERTFHRFGHPRTILPTPGEALKVTRRARPRPPRFPALPSCSSSRPRPQEITPCPFCKLRPC